MAPVIDPTRQRLLEAAEQIFAEQGFEGTSIRAICKQANANIAAVNFYFRSKQGLYNEAVKYAHRGCTQGEPLPEWPSDTPAVDKLRDFIRVMVARMQTPQSPASLQLMLREMAQPTEACKEVVREYIRPMAEKLGSILAELLPQATPRERTLTAFSIVGQCIFYRTHRAIATELVGEEEFAKFDVDLVAKHITAFTLNALGLAEKSASPVRSARGGRGKSKRLPAAG